MDEKFEKAKTCRKRGERKPDGEFGKGRNTCHACEAERQRHYQQAHPDRVAEQHRRYYQAHRDKQAEWNRRWRQAHPDEKAERDRRYRQAHPDEKAERDRRYRRAHPDEIAEKNRRYRRAHPDKMAEQEHRRRALKKNALPPDVTPAMILKHLAEQMKRQKGRCYYCGGKFIKGHRQFKPTRDHVIPIDRGGEHRPENLVWAHAKCNYSKQNRSPREWPEGGRLL